MANETHRKYEDIRKEYETKWLKKRYKGKLMYSLDFIYIKLGEQFYLSPTTIEKILTYRSNLTTF